MMPIRTRSTHGCWTCRLRKKKCDESILVCSQCAAHDLPCHYKDHRPEWMDGGPKEAKVAKDMKILVQQSLVRKKFRRSLVRQQARQNTREDPATGATTSLTPSNRLSTPVPVHHSDTSTLVEGSIQSSAAVPATVPSANEYSNDLGASVLAEDGDTALLQDRTRLLMHFFDHVFPTEFPCYQAPIVEGGRGWLMSLLMRARPLYHAALSVSAYHQTAVLTANCTQCQYQTWNAIQEHHTLALKELQKNMEELRSREIAQRVDDAIDVLASIVQLISFELFIGNTSIWQTHLQAALSLFCTLIGPAETSADSWWKIAGPPQKPQPFYIGSVMERGEPYDANKIAMNFLSAVLMWFDILSCVSVSSQPTLQPYHHLLSNNHCGIRMDIVMGCKNEVMILIGKIAALDEWRKKLKGQGKLSMIQLVSRAAKIKDDLKAEMNKSVDVDPTGAISWTTFDTTSRSCKMTQIFATSALTYVHGVVSGLQPDLPEIQESVTETITLLQGLSDQSLIRGLAWPICITGCMASKGQEAIFRNMITNLGIEAFVFGSFRKALRTMEKCWECREDSWDWNSCMNSLGSRMLII